jgi:hypothetical protein
MPGRPLQVHACVRDATDPTRTEHLLAMNAAGAPSLHVGRSTAPGRVVLCEGDVTKPGSYDAAFTGCSAVIHVWRPGGPAGDPCMPSPPQILKIARSMADRDAPMHDLLWHPRATAHRQVGTPMGYGGANDFRQIFHGAVA